jgi:hypothetical protein
MAIMLACEKCPEPLAVDTAKTREELIGIALSNRWTIGKWGWLCPEHRLAR